MLGSVKTAVIVPVGVKGGFVVKKPPLGTSNPEADSRPGSAKEPRATGSPSRGYST
ncbi:NAD-glutamate dehydrogenase domain-containing protein [Rhodococcus jostii]|uniref:NAD-glutamate dehydrogenase domain-containing protein n=1 Tax=Rhodococcus jostii TaxID=132919 RepID=UPI0039829EFF